jgi:hypothetical protein
MYEPFRNEHRNKNREWTPIDANEIRQFVFISVHSRLKMQHIENGRVSKCRQAGTREQVATVRPAILSLIHTIIVRTQHEISIRNDVSAWDRIRVESVANQQTQTVPRSHMTRTRESLLLSLSVR